MSTTSYRRWTQICQEIELDQLDQLISEVSQMTDLTLDTKLDVIESTDHLDDPSFECYLWTIRKIHALNYLAIFSSSHEERMKHVTQIFWALFEEGSIPDVYQEDPELAHSLKEEMINQRIQVLLETYGEPCEGELECLPSNLKPAQIPREQVIQHLRPILDPEQRDPQILMDAIRWGLTCEGFLVLSEECQKELLEKIQILSVPGILDVLDVLERDLIRQITLLLTT